MSGTILWFRLDLRLHDNPALAEAVRLGAPVYPVFIWAPEEEDPWQPGAASRWWLHHSLTALAKELTALGAKLILRAGNTTEVFERLLEDTGADCIFWSERLEPQIIERDRKLKKFLQKKGAKVRTFNSALLLRPDSVLVDAERPYRVFTPFYNKAKALIPPAPLPAPTQLPPSSKLKEIETLQISALKLLPRIPWDTGLREFWNCGEQAAIARLQKFKGSIASGYNQGRNVPSKDGTSLMSPYLHFGEISPRLIWHGFAPHMVTGNEGETSFIRELYWREFACHILLHFPQTAEEPMRPEFKRMPWQSNREAEDAWQRGLTGFPIVDAGMRQLWHTGWMHNRVRMIAASFLAKDLLLPWKEGAQWFWDTLVDADLANNTMGWQWVAGSGVDAAPFFRIFNPATQGRRFDPDGAYIRQWLPELAKLPAQYIHWPSQAPPVVLKLAGIELGATYPFPIIDHSQARKNALKAFADLRA